MPIKLNFKHPGEPADVLYIEDYVMPKPEETEILIQTIAAAVNPVDINLIQGKYPLQIDTPGYEGVGKVIKVGTGVKTVKVGDTVIPLIYEGIWRTHFTMPEENVMIIPKEINAAEAATLYVNPTTMYVMLKEYIKLELGDTVIQNGANSACGVVAIQMCKAWGIKTVNVVRNRPEIDQLKSFLKELGATYVFTEEEIKNTDIFKTGQVNKPILGLNCVGGESANNILRHLDDDGVLVTYGGMSLEPIRVSTTVLVFKTIRLEGFNLTKWAHKQSPAKQRQILTEIINMVLEGKLKAPPHIFVDFLKYEEAVKNTLAKGGMIGKKYILDFRSLASKI